MSNYMINKPTIDHYRCDKCHDMKTAPVPPMVICEKCGKIFLFCDKCRKTPIQCDWCGCEKFTEAVKKTSGNLILE